MNKKAKKPSHVQSTGAAEAIQFQIPRQVTQVLSQTRSAFFGLCPSGDTRIRPVSDT